MGRIFVIGGVNSPTISCKIHTSAASADHRLDTDHQSFRKPGAMSGTSVIGDAGRLVHFPGDASLIGTYVKVRITDSSTWALTGEKI